MAGIDAFGTVWAMHDGSSSFDDIGEVTSLDVLDVEVDDLDVSSHDSTGQWREYVAGMKDGGELSMEVNYDPALHGAIFSALGEERAQRITLPDGGAATVTFDAYVKGMTAQAPHDDKLSATITLKVTGPVTITP